MANEASVPKPLTLRRRFKNLRRWTVARLAQLALQTLSLLPFALMRRVLPVLVRASAFAWRGKAEAQLALAYGDHLSRRERRRIANRVAWNLGLFLAELLASWRGKLPDDYIEIGEEIASVHVLLDEDKGAVGITGHIGNWELLGQVFQRAAGERAGPAIAKRNPNPWLNEFIAQSRARLGWQIVFQDQGVRPLLRALRAGKLLGTVPDQDIRRVAGIFVPFFGRDAYTSTGPASLAVFGGAPLIVGFLRRKDYGLVLDLYPPLRPDPEGERETEVERLTRAWTRIVETQIRKQPEDWMWFHQRWRTTPERLAQRRAAHRGHAD